VNYIKVKGCLISENSPASGMMVDTDHLLPNNTTSHRSRPQASHTNRCRIRKDQ